MRRSAAPVVIVISIGFLAALLLGWYFAPAPVPVQAPKPETESTTQAGPMSFDDLAALLKGYQDTPSALRFGGEFTRSPKLRKLWNEFVDRDVESRAQGRAGPTAEEFFHALRKEREFGALVAQFSRDAAFRAVVEDLSKKSPLGSAFRAASAESIGQGTPGTRSADSGRVFGTFAADGSQAAAREVGAASTESEVRAPALQAAGRRSSDTRPEGHWVQKGGDAPDPMAVCSKLGGTDTCKQIIADCRKDPVCSRRLASMGAGGGVASSTGTAKDRRQPAFKKGQRTGADGAP